MAQEPPKGPDGDREESALPIPPWESPAEKDQTSSDDLLERMLREAKQSDDDTSPPGLSEAEATEDAAGGESFDNLFEQRVRQAVQEIGSTSDAAAPPEEDDNPLGVYAQLDQAEAPPAKAEPRPSGRPSKRRDDEPRQDAAEPAVAPSEETLSTEEDLPGGDEPVVEESMELESLSRRSSAGHEFAESRPEPVSRVQRERPSHVADDDPLTPEQQVEADRLAAELSAAGPLLAVRYGLMRNIGLFEHHLEQQPGPGVQVTIRTERGVELGETVTGVCEESCGGSCLSCRRVSDFAIANGPEYSLEKQGKVLRVAHAQDLADDRRLKDVCRQARAYCMKQIRELSLPMRLVTVEHLLGGERMIFFFTAETRVDFRDLVKCLSTEYQTRVELRQVGARDEARLVGDFERCGRQCCCQSFLKDLKPVSMRMAKVQKATLDPSKISGRCNRLMCCLRYEDGGYQELRGVLPKKNIWVRTEDLIGRVLKTHIITQLVEVELPDRTRVAVGVEEIVERDVPAPALSAVERPDARQRGRPERRGPARMATVRPEPPSSQPDEAACEEPTQGPDSGPSKSSRRRRRRPKSKRADQTQPASGQTRDASQKPADGTSQAKNSKRRRRHRRKKRPS